MKLVKVDASDVASLKKKRRGKWNDIVIEFADSGEKVAEVKDFDCNANSAYHRLHVAIARTGLSVAAMTRRGRVFLVRTDD